MSSPPRIGAFRGCLLGGAIGDALGFPVEFMKTAAIEEQYGRSAPASLCLDGGSLARISDDTQMTLFTAEGMIRAKQQRDATPAIAFALLRWYETQGGRPSVTGSEPGWLLGERRLHSQRAPGMTCMSALEALGSGTVLTLPTVDTPPNDSKGCGAVMRVAPCGLGATSREHAYELARDSGVITHGHPSGYLSAAYFAAVIWDLARSASLPDAMTNADALLVGGTAGDEMRRCIAHARRLAKRGPPTAAIIESLGGGWVGEEALAIAVLCALTYDPSEPRALEQALWRAAAHSGDSDSTAALTGNMLGATLGLAALPPSWLAVLELRSVIDRIATDLYAVMIQGETNPAYPTD